MFKKLLIANRGEIARRICQVAHRMGIPTVAVHSDADAELPFVREADQAVRIGAAPPRESYLNATAVIEAARKTGAEAIHPGYGFLSESADFALACANAGIAFVGPSPQSMARMKDKSEARRIVQAAGVPSIPGSARVLADAREAAEIAEQIGFPVLCKAAAGGGGIGMAVAANPTELEKVFRQCSDRALSAFGRGGVYLERFFASPRHIEVQILGDQHGHLIHCLERECSIQRRHQKVVEEAPSPLFVTGAAGQPPPPFGAAITAAKAFGYSNAGTVEFLYAQGSFYFIEMNARLQVEHPITELTTGLDLIGWQLRIAAGEALTVEQGELRRNGAAIRVSNLRRGSLDLLPLAGGDQNAPGADRGGDPGGLRLPGGQRNHPLLRSDDRQAGGAGGDPRGGDRPIHRRARSISNRGREDQPSSPPANRAKCRVSERQHSHRIFGEPSQGLSLFRQRGDSMAEVAAHITGTVWKIEVRLGQSVAAGDTLVILESMKMEMPVEATEAGTVKEIRCREAQPVKEGEVLIVLG